jgi:hypothetical protein
MLKSFAAIAFVDGLKKPEKPAKTITKDSRDAVTVLPSSCRMSNLALFISRIVVIYMNPLDHIVFDFRKV